jgi:hypothetical protein
MCQGHRVFNPKESARFDENHVGYRDKRWGGLVWKIGGAFIATELR